ncbi:sensor histidine kinase [Streptomyces sp. NPDC058374]|uniref:sensor histidine kinase n=1 Tax=unclassified Streptomyces TaxID=2593676 RepID=UPI003662672C
MPSRPRARLRLPRGRAVDAALSSGLFLVAGLGTLRSLIGSREEPWALTAANWALIAVACGALYFSSRRPVAAASVAALATAVYYVTSAYDGPLLLAVVAALFMVAAAGRLRAAVVIAALCLIGTALGTLQGNGDVNHVALFMLTGWFVAMITLGGLRHTHLARARETEERAATQERLRIARELHDVVGHHLSLINVQSAAALRRLTKDPAAGAGQAAEALGAVKDASREALRELRATLGVLRDAGEAAPTAPAPGLARIGELTDAARAAGLTVTVHRTGRPGPLPVEADLAAYRIVQESLTNVARHARATRAEIRLDGDGERLTVTVTDDGRGPVADPARTGPPGSGVAGMRERARALGGDLTAEAAPGGGFAVRATLPLAPTEEPRP